MAKRFGVVWGITVYVFATRGLIRLGPTAKADLERLQTSMLEAGFEHADYSTKWQRPTTPPSPGMTTKI